MIIRLCMVCLAVGHFQQSYCIGGDACNVAAIWVVHAAADGWM